ncbi:hypothetical protein BCR32DRAFT_329148 [Anaeromyces robustus]|uniref:Uncharacterized protein n=1 Tax=Anaeromyces robustus TaxID=1754192 RepID=A0A1Y1WUH7_9FUNG|nr:hypothetical protein BCR32DRAFT_329148 [Anaeromyces robustus]|eukprot:ORX76876.1 hypothetical protein BCR32DRAFT_329148 [Anaeromyces robustus]
MLRYASHHNYEKKAVRKSHEKTKSNKRKSRKNETISTDIEVKPEAFKTSKKNIKKYNNDDNDSYFQSENEYFVLKTWKDSWKRPLNNSIIIDDYSTSSEKIRTDKTSRRQNSRRNNYVVDMLTTDY